MNNLKSLSLFFCAVLGLTAGCTTNKTSEPAPHAGASAPSATASAPRVAAAESDSATLQGTWKGKEIGGQSDGDVLLIISGQGLEYRGADPGEWYKGTFTLHEDTKPKQLIGEVRDCPEPKYIGKRCLAIYRIDSDKLTITGNEPGNPEVPPAFDAADSRRFVLVKQ